MKQPLGILFRSFCKQDIVTDAVSVIHSKILNIQKVKCCRALMLSSYTRNFCRLSVEDFNKLLVHTPLHVYGIYSLILYIERST